MERALGAISRMEIAVGMPRAGPDLHGLSDRVDAPSRSITEIAGRPTCSRSTPRSRPPGPATAAEDLPSSPTRSAHRRISAARAVRDASETALRIRGGIKEVVVEMGAGSGGEHGRPHRRWLPRRIAPRVAADLRRERHRRARRLRARLAEEIAAEIRRILGDSSDGVARQTIRALAEVSTANARAAIDAGQAACEIEDALGGIATSAHNLDRIAAGLRAAAGRFQLSRRGGCGVPSSPDGLASCNRCRK